MARPPLPLGTWGAIRTERVRRGAYRSHTRYRDEDGLTRKVTATGSTAAAAERALRQVLADRFAPTAGRLHTEMRLAQLGDCWLEHLRAEGRIERSSINEYERVLRNAVVPAVGGLRIREATTGRLDRFLMGLKATSSSRQRKAKVVLGAMLDLAVRHDVIAVNPVRTTSRIHREKREPRALRVEDLAALRGAVTQWMSQDRPGGPRPNNDMAHIVDLMLGTGCRIGEVLALRWRDVDLESDRPTVTISGTIKTESGLGTYRKPRPKSDAGLRTLVLPPFAAAILRERRDAAEPNPLDAIFVTRNGTWHQVGNVERRWRQIRRDTDFEWVTPHTFRKTVATLIAERTDSETAAQQLGHASAEITRDFYVAKPAVAADVSDLLQDLGQSPCPQTGADGA